MTKAEMTVVVMAMMVMMVVGMKMMIVKMRVMVMMVLTNPDADGSVMLRTMNI